MSSFRGRRGAGDGRAPRPDVAADPDADPYAVARTIVLDQLTVRARSRAELATTLARRGVPDDVAVSVLDRMEEVRLVDDAAFTALIEHVVGGTGIEQFTDPTLRGDQFTLF